ncbi:MAG: C-GCAxxG-C-C family protein [Synergistaceae bacterium]|nr:C-GCAxxG-C-C family protein [Synergistaceae bacterium]
MTKKEIADKAVYYKHNGYNCAQAVVKALSEAMGKECSTLLLATAGFATGMGTMDATCGALIGANLVVGLATERKNTLDKSRTLYHKFLDSCGATICKDLKGKNSGVVMCSCEDCTRNAVIAAIDVINFEK